MMRMMRLKQIALGTGVCLVALTCGGGSPLRPSVTIPPVRLSVRLVVTNTSLGTAVPADFTLAAENNAGFLTWQGSKDITVPGNAPYEVVITAAPDGYSVTRSASCSGANAPHTALPPCAITATESPLRCDDTLWALTYRVDRLQVVSSCAVASGIVQRTITAHDGDLVLDFVPDPPYRGLLREGNRAIGNDLVVEIPCQGPIDQADAISTCDRYQGRKVSVSPGTHIAAAAHHVLDRNHGMWAELHGATIRLLPR